MRRLAYALLLAAAAVYCLPAQAAIEPLGSRKILDLGCHHADGTCFVSLDGAPFGASLGCVHTSTNQFRFDNSETAAGRRTYAAMLAAMLSNRSVAVTLTGCSNQGFPTVSWWILLP